MVEKGDDAAGRDGKGRLSVIGENQTAHSVANKVDQDLVKRVMSGDAEANMQIAQRAPRHDGYRPISDAIWAWGSIAQKASREQYRVFWSAARRLDTGHRQIERVREALSDMPPAESIAGKQAMHEVIGDAEMGVWSIDKAIEIIVSLSGLYRIERPFPPFVREKQALVARLRDHYSHIDDRALGKVGSNREVNAEEAEKAFHMAALVSDRILTDGVESLGIDAEATQLCDETRGYLLEAWADVCAPE